MELTTTKAVLRAALIERPADNPYEYVGLTGMWAADGVQVEYQSCVRDRADWYHLLGFTFTALPTDGRLAVMNTDEPITMVELGSFRSGRTTFYPEG
ncbi:hypothetical protein ACIA8K_12495 [Catenuloplanes sp. NPDC051500]|uniref:hypothetical protein n=1 Tax=Catenuloplanes sp. NPDC051500 TaxID=3363959 RepID=UPI0037A62715